MSKLNWLKSQLSEWQQHELVSPEQVAAIIAYYDSKPHVSLARIMMSVIGAVLFGLGVILFFAFNWVLMPKAAKLVVVFSGLAVTQLAGLWFGLRKDNRVLGEGLLGVGMLFFGAGIFLVSQIYHIDEHFPNAFIAWGLAALAMAWAVGSIPQGFIAVGLLGLWYSVELQSFHHPMHAAAPLVALGLLPLAWRERAAWLFITATITSLVMITISATHGSERWFIVYGMLLATAMVTIAPSLEGSRLPQVERSITKLGYLGYVALLYFFSFDNSARALEKPVEWSGTTTAYFALFSVAAVFALAAATRRELGRARESRQIHYGLVVVSTVLVLLAIFGAKGLAPWIWVWANVVLLGHAVLWIAEGSKDQHGRKVAAAALVFAMIAVPRFLDLFDSLLMRAFMFSVLGGGLFFLGNFYKRSKHSTAKAGGA